MSRVAVACGLLAARHMPLQGQGGIEAPVHSRMASSASWAALFRSSTSRLCTFRSSSSCAEGRQPASARRGAD